MDLTHFQTSNIVWPLRRVSAMSSMSSNLSKRGERQYATYVVPLSTWNQPESHSDNVLEVRLARYLRVAQEIFTCFIIGQVSRV